MYPDSLGLFASFFTHSPVGLQIYDATGHSVMVNDAFLRIFGTSPPPEYSVLEDEVAERAGVLGIIKRAFAGEIVNIPPIWYDPRELRGNQGGEGKRVAMEATLVPLRDDAERVTHVAVVVHDLTATYSAKEEAERRSSMLNAVLEQLPTGMAIVAPDGRVMFANDALRKLTGANLDIGSLLTEEQRKIEARDAKGQPYAPGDRPINRALRGESCAQERMLLVRRDGTQSVALASATPVRAPDGHVVAAVGAYHDVTAHEEREAKLELLFSSQVIGICDWRADGQIAGCNDEYLRTVGFDRHDLEAGRVSWVAMTPPEYVAADRKALQEIRERGRCTPFEKELIRKDGARVPVLIGAAAFQPEGASGIAFLLDLSDRRAAEDAHRKSERRFRALVENSFDVIRLLDAEGRILYASPASERILGAPAASFVGRMITDFIHPEDQAASLTSFKACLAQPGVQMVSGFRHRHPDGTWRHLEVSRVNWLHDPDIGAVVAHVRDVTDKKALEEQFLQAQKMEAVGQLAGGVAHDFNNLLSVIVSLGKLARGGLREDDPLAADMDEILRAADRATGLTRKLLAFSRKQVMRPTVVMPNLLVSEAEQLLRRVIGEDIELHLSLDANAGPIKADAGQIEQVLLNLAVNARDAMPDGGRLTIETADVQVDGDDGDLGRGRWVLIRVRDTGQGMDEATRLRAFEPFFTTKPLGRGTGLGLSTVYGIVKQSGGHVVVDSRPGLGATFEIYLPVTSERPAPPPRLPRAQLIHRGETVLLVEDDDAVRALARRILVRGGYRVLEAQSGGDALLLVEKNPGPIDLLLTDVVMPRMSGRELAERLRAVRPEIRTLYMSGYTDDAIVHRGVLDDSAFVEKPLVPEVLTAAVRRVLA